MRRSRTYPSTPAARLGVDDEEMIDQDEYHEPNDFDLLFPSPEDNIANNNDRYSPVFDLMMDHDDDNSNNMPQPHPGNNNNNATTTAALVHNIASFLTLSDDTASFEANHATNNTNNNVPSNNLTATAVGVDGGGSSLLISPADSWAVGLELQEDPSSSWNYHSFNNSNNSNHNANNDSRDNLCSLSQIETPLTPALVALSPGATPRYADNDDDDHHHHRHHHHPYSHRNRDEDHQDENNLNRNIRQHHSASHESLTAYEQYDDNSESSSCGSSGSRSSSSSSAMEALLRERRRRWAQEKIAHAVFAHPRSLRSFCWEAYQAASEIRLQKQQQQQQMAAAAAAAASTAAGDESPPETQVEPDASARAVLAHQRRPLSKKKRATTATHRRRRQRIVAGMKHKQRVRRFFSCWAHRTMDGILHAVPVSVALDLLEVSGGTALDTTDASFHVAAATLHFTVSATGRTACAAGAALKHGLSNPFAVLEAIVSLQFNAMGKTSEVLVSGIQSVATGVGSASSLALYRLSTSASQHPSFVHLGGSVVGNHNLSRMGQHASNISGGRADGRPRGKLLSQRLLRKLSDVNDAARVVEYRETSDESNLTRHAVSRTRRMMHYSVSLRPFVATIAVPAAAAAPSPAAAGGQEPPGHPIWRSSSYNNEDGPLQQQQQQEQSSWSSHPDHRQQHHQRRDSASTSRSSSEEEETSSPFMCTPQSFPPTPHSRRRVIAQRSQLSDDVVFLARDRLRVHGGLESSNPRTRERSRALVEGKCLAVFSRDTKESGIELTCGQHIASKVSDAYYYASTRSLVSILRNCFVYFELTVLPRPDLASFRHPPVATLSVGLSTAEMPPNTLVGAWQGSVGLCTTGQILMAGQWCSPANPIGYGVGATVGCLVCLDDESAFETWDGLMVKAKLRFNVNGVMVSSPVSTLPMSGGPGAPAVVMTSSSPTTTASERSFSSPPQRLPSTRQQPSPPSMSTTVTTLHLLVPAAEELYPTVTLQSSETSVACRFSSEDVLATTREVIGAPAGVAVYGVDGSVILNEDED